MLSQLIESNILLGRKSKLGIILLIYSTHRLVELVMTIQVTYKTENEKNYYFHYKLYETHRLVDLSSIQ